MKHNMTDAIAYVFHNTIERAYSAFRYVREANFQELLSAIGVLQWYARIRKARVPATLYTTDYYLGHDGCEGHREFLETQGGKLSPRLATVFACIKNVEGSSFLDLGCGRGEISHYLEERAKRVVSVDYSADSVRIARRILQKAEIIQADVVELLPQFNSEPFDGILMIDIAEHLFDWELEIVFANLDRLLKPDGYIYVDTPIIPRGNRHSTMHVNIKRSSKEYLRFLPGFVIIKETITDPVGSNHLMIFVRGNQSSC